MELALLAALHRGLARTCDPTGDRPPRTAWPN